MTSRPVVPAGAARRLLLAGQGLLADPARRATPAAVYREIERLGFVQVDTINVVARAHEHILFSRFDGFAPRMLARLAERDRSLFEHYTHDASLIPTRWYPYWQPRFAALRRRLARRGWLRQRLGARPQRTIRAVRERIVAEGPLMSRDFEAPPRGGGPTWWSMKPQKAALEYLWRTGELAVSRRVRFQKVWDLAERVIPAEHRGAAPARGAVVDWACGEALRRLVVATPGEIAGFFAAVPAKSAQDWCRRAVRAGELVEVDVEGVGGARPRRAFALPDWARRARDAGAPPERMRLLSPFDPAIRDRARTQRLFGFDYTVEMFVPAARRRYGYFVLPVLEGERLVGRVDPAFDRGRGVLAVRRLWWEPGIRPTRRRRRALEAALERLAGQIGASSTEISRKATV